MAKLKVTSKSAVKLEMQDGRAFDRQAYGKVPEPHSLFGGGAEQRHSRSLGSYSSTLMARDLGFA